IDIPILAEYFLKNFLQEYHLTNKKFSSAAILKLLKYDWPGNIRELENVVQQAVLLSENSLIQPASIRIQNSSDNDNCSGGSYKEEKQKAIEKFEEEYLIRLLMIHKGNISQAAKEARKDRRDFGRLIKKYDINLSHYRRSKFFFDDAKYAS
ncbi:sigma-54-dependent Fis family transcriptional regulator, partial [candidate division KSB1 bacterium]|nr:sigma-54-dependent Fis family transcriptional regulator [candidate division KSB1 bacterium]